MAALLACPFCRELYSAGEAKCCRVCEVPLVPLERLPPSIDAQHEAAERGELSAPEDQTLPWTFLGAGRGPLLLLAALGVLLFFAPWVQMSKPESVSISGFDLARARIGWLWGGAVGWFILIPLLASRRTLRRLRGVRVISMTFAVMTLLEVLVLIALSPTSNRYMRVEYDWGWGLIASAVVSAVAAFVAARLGAAVDPHLPRPEASMPIGGAPKDRTLH
jgi:hypothetical protein